MKKSNYNTNFNRHTISFITITFLCFFISCGSGEGKWQNNCAKGGFHVWHYGMFSEEGKQWLKHSLEDRFLICNCASVSLQEKYPKQDLYQIEKPKVIEVINTCQKE